MSKLLPSEQKTLDSYNATAGSYDANHPDRAYWLVDMRRFYQFLPGGRVLEIGSGAGRDARILASLGYNYTGTDISAGLIKAAAEAVPDQTFQVMSVYDLTFPGHQKFDGFWAAASLLHIPKTRIDEALQSIRSVVKPDGIGFISLKDGEGERVELHDMNGSQLKRLFAYWNLSEFICVLGKNGYTTVDYFRRSYKDVEWHCFFVRV